MCHISVMKHLNIRTCLISAALVMGLAPTASAQSEEAETAIPYAITFDGSFYPTSMDTIGYPYNEASLRNDGECALRLITDADDNITAMSVLACSSEAFRNEASRFVRTQMSETISSEDLKAHTLYIKWDIGDDAITAPTLELASAN